MEKILDIIDSIAYEKGIESKSVCSIVKEGILQIAREEISQDYEYFIEEDEKMRTLRLFYKVQVCADDDERVSEQNPNFIAISRVGEDNISVGDTLEYELSLDSMKRGAINKLFLSIESNLQREMEEQLLNSLKEKLQQIVAGVVVGIDSEENTFVEINGIRAILPQKNRIKGESFKVGQTIKALLKFVGIGRNGIRLELSRTTPKFLEELLRLEVPELKDDEIQIYKSARIPGERAKVAIWTNNARIDPVGCCVGVKGVRINAVSSELNGENIDCVEYSQSLEQFIARALAPAQITSIKILKESPDSTQSKDVTDSPNNQEKPKAIVQIKPDQKSKAIGKKGINIRLASMLCDCEIELKEIAPVGESQAQDAHTPSQTQSENTEKKGVEALESLFKN